MTWYRSCCHRPTGTQNSKKESKNSRSRWRTQSARTIPKRRVSTELQVRGVVSYFLFPFVPLTRACAYCTGLSVRDFLIMPVQRVPRYKTLIDELQKVTPADFRDKELLRQAFLAIKQTASFIDDTIRFKEGITRVRVSIWIFCSLHLLFGALLNPPYVCLQTKKLVERFKPRMHWLIQPGRALVMFVIVSRSPVHGWGLGFS